MSRKLQYFLNIFIWTFYKEDSNQKNNVVEASRNINLLNDALITTFANENSIDKNVRIFTGSAFQEFDIRFL